VLVLWQVADHASFNAHNYQPSWPQVPAPGFPVVLSGMWSLGGHGRGLSVASVVLLVACLGVDTHRRHLAAGLAPVGPDRPRPGGAVNDTEPGLPVLGWWATTLTPHATASPSPRARAARVVLAVGTAIIRALAQWVADLGVAVAAHAPQPGEPRTAALLRGRVITVQVRQIRTEAMDLTTPGTEPAARRRFALLAAVLGVLAVAVCVVWGAHMATAIGTSLQLDGDGPYLAGLLDNVGDWWNGLNGWQQLAVGAGVAALVALSGGSLALAFGISGVATYGLAHAHGAATLTRDPLAATRSYAANTTPAEALLDAGEFALTFAPGNFAGAAAGRGARIIGEELARDPAAFWAARRTAMHGDAGQVEIGLLTGLRRSVDDVPVDAPTSPARASLGWTDSTDYRRTFFTAHPDLQGQVWVHHAVEQQALRRYPGVVQSQQVHSLENLRGIPKAVNSEVHLSQIRRDWNRFYRTHASPTLDDLLDFATKVDETYGTQFLPEVR
jgi:hypothetical protein